MGPGTPGGGGPLTPPGGPLGPLVPPDAPTSGAGGRAQWVDAASWQTWWTYNRDRYLQVATFLSGLGSGTGASAATTVPSDEELAEVVVPALERALVGGGSMPVLRGALLALAEVERARGASGLGLDHFTAHYLASDVPEAVEAAILALGVRGDPGSIPLLRAIVLDEPEGREALDRPVGVRQRAYAAYALGLVGRRAVDEDTRLAAVDGLLLALGADVTATRETQVACAIAAGQVTLPFCADDPERLARHAAEGERHLCGGVQLEYLLATFGDEELDPWLRAHSAPAMGRLAREAPDSWRAAVTEALSGATERRSGAPAEVRQASAIGLGLLATASGDDVDRAARKRLARLAKDADPLVQRFALVGLAEAAGRRGAGQDAGTADEAGAMLLRELARGRGGLDSWSALGLGVLGHSLLESRRVVPADLGRALRTRLARAEDPELAAACLLALGVLRDGAAAKDVRGFLDEDEHPALRGTAALVLGLMGARDARDEIARSLEEAVARVEEDEGEDEDGARARARTALELELAIGLRLLGDASVVPALVERLAEIEDDAARAAVANALGLVGDARAARPLAAALADRDADDSVRAAAASALGRLCDRDRRAWDAPYAAGLHYQLQTWTLRSPFGDGTGLLDAR